LPSFGAVDLAILIQKPFAEFINHRLIARRAFGIGTVSQRICVNGVCAKCSNMRRTTLLPVAILPVRPITNFAGQVAQMIPQGLENG
jgi:hypothetical protein